jgi:hypothetical protein
MKKLIQKIKSLFIKKYYDAKLAKYKWESTHEANDGWTKLHYKNLYKQRKSLLRKTKSI